MRWDAPQQAKELYDACGAFMKRHAMIPVPHNFELSFRYLKHTDPLARQIGRTIIPI
jgi:hypothetical protein